MSNFKCWYKCFTFAIYSTFRKIRSRNARVYHEQFNKLPISKVFLTLTYTSLSSLWDKKCQDYVIFYLALNLFWSVVTIALLLSNVINGTSMTLDQNSQNCHKQNITVGKHSLSTVNYSFQNVNCKISDSLTLSVVFICKILLTVLTIVYEY